MGWYPQSAGWKGAERKGARRDRRTSTWRRRGSGRLGIALALVAASCGLPEPTVAPEPKPMSSRSALTTWTSTGGQHLDAPGVSPYMDWSFLLQNAYSLDLTGTYNQSHSILGAPHPSSAGWAQSVDQMAPMTGSPSIVNTVISSWCNRNVFFRRADSTLRMGVEWHGRSVWCGLHWNALAFVYPSIPGAVVMGSPAATGWGHFGASPLTYEQRFDVFARSPGDHLAWITGIGTEPPPGVEYGGGIDHVTFGGWRIIDSITLAPDTDPAVISTAEGEFDLFVTLTNWELYTIHFDAVSGWGAWVPLGGALTSGPGATGIATGGGGKRLDVVARHTSGGYWARTYFDATLAANQNVPAGWQPWRNCGGSFTSKPAVTYDAYFGYQRADLVVFGKGQDNAIWTGICNPTRRPLPPLDPTDTL